ncbi:MAG TPA: hypothetical protein VFI91_05810 [Longimicrobiaceae bacterium]|nr:hypothetical protein [Longimicrobiaceae bacterium]
MKMLHVGRLVATATMLAGCAPSAISQTPQPVQAGVVIDTTLYAGMEWDNIGPNRGGRSIAVAGSDSRPLEYYFGATGGGLWKTTDGGTTWNPVTDGQITSSSVGAIGVCQANPDIVYIGTGEVQLRGNILPGDGLYKSTDAGETWEHIGLREARNFGRVRVDPNDCNRVYAAAFGHYGAPNPERGVYRSLDGGDTWEKVLFRDERTGAVDISIDQTNPNVIYAALWEAWRKPWGMSSGGPGSGLFKSTDGGTTWTELSDNPGLPDGILGKIGVSVSAADPNRVYAIIEADSGGVFRSDDAGLTWTKTNTERDLRQRAFYYTRIYADPQEVDRVYVLNVDFFRSDDGGETFDTEIDVPHGDNHDLWIASNDNQRMVQANDGGGNVSWNGGETWTEQDYPTAQMYRVSTTEHEPYFVCGGQQDNSTICVPSSGWDHLLARGLGGDGDYGYAVGGGESGYVAPDPTDTDLFYAGSYGGRLTRYDHLTGQARAVNVWPENPMGESAIDMEERFQWTFPIVFSKTDPDVLYTTSQHVWRSTNEGQSWERISPDLTRADPKTLGPSGGPITKDQTGVETFATVFALGTSPLDGDIIWAGSDDGLVHVTRDGGASWQNVTPAGIPDYVKITTIDASPHAPGTAYMAGNRFLIDDFAPYIYRTDDFGQSWTKITNGLGEDEIVRSVREDIVRPGLLYAGTESGVRVSFDDGAHWQDLSLNLPDVQVSDLTVEDQDLVIATHGRSFYVLRNISTLRQLTPDIAAKEIHLFAPAMATRGVDNGVTVDYFLEEPADKVTLDFIAPDGEVIRSLSTTRAEVEDEDEEEDSGRRGRQDGPSTDAGSNRFIWNLRYPGFTEFPGMILWAARSAGPVIVPGEYTVRLTVDGEVQTQQFRVRMDPRLTDVTVQELQERFDLALKIRDKVSQANEAVLLIRGIEQQVDSTLARTDSDRIEAAANELTTAMDEVEVAIYQVKNQSGQDPLNYPIKLNNKIAALMGVVGSADAPPTDQTYAVFAELSAELDQELAKLDAVLARELEPLNALLAEEGLDRITRTPLEVEEEG